MLLKHGICLQDIFYTFNDWDVVIKHKENSNFFENSRFLIKFGCGYKYRSMCVHSCMCIHLNLNEGLTQRKYWLLKKINMKSNLIDDMYDMTRPSQHWTFLRVSLEITSLCSWLDYLQAAQLKGQNHLWLIAHPEIPDSIFCVLLIWMWNDHRLCRN